jgi:hypothetical protein
LKIDQSECSKSPINLHQRNNTCVVPHSEHLVKKKWIIEECVRGHGVLRFQLSGPNFQAVYGIWLKLNLTCILWL